MGGVWTEAPGQIVSTFIFYTPVCNSVEACEISAGGMNKGGHI